MGPTDYVFGVATILKEGVTSSYERELKASALHIAGHDFGEFEKRPLSEPLVRYAAQDTDTSYHFKIYDVYKGLVWKNVAGRVLRETRTRIEHAESWEWNPHSRDIPARRRCCGEETSLRACAIGVCSSRYRRSSFSCLNSVRFGDVA